MPPGGGENKAAFLASASQNIFDGPGALLWFKGSPWGDADIRVGLLPRVPPRLAIKVNKGFKLPIAV